jgi:glycosyltransferase involved in cell wall biosynthesis
LPGPDLLMTKVELPMPGTPVQRIMLIFSGVKFDLDRDCGLRLRRLSQHFEGVSFVAHPNATQMIYDKFRLTAIKFKGGGLGFSLRFFFGGLAWAIRERRQGGRIALVTTTDPLKTGLLGWCIAKIVGAKFAPEVNGDYWDRANYLDETGPFRGWIKRKLVRRMVTFVLTRADGIRILYPKQLDFLALRLKKKVVRSIFDFIDVSAFDNRGEDKVVLFAGFPFYLKALDVLIDAFKRVAPKYPDWSLKIVGWFPDRSVLDAHCAGHPQIVYHPPVYHREMPEHIGRAAIVVLPSRSEGMGRVLLEAMAAGKPRIGADVGGIPTVIDNDKDGLLFQAENAEQLARQLDRLMADSRLRATMGEAGRVRAHKSFTLDCYIECISQFYLDVIGAGTAGEETGPSTATGKQ